MKFQPKTRGEYDYRILADDLPGECPLAVWAAHPHADGYGVIVRVDKQGRQAAGVESIFDLLPAPQEVWVNIRDDGGVYGYPTKELAERCGSIGTVARKCLPYNPGEFDE